MRALTLHAHAIPCLLGRTACRLTSPTHPVPRALPRPQPQEQSPKRKNPRQTLTPPPPSRLLSTTLHAHALSPSHLAPALHAARAALFPSNALGAPRSPPDATEAAAIRRECARAIVGVVPPVVRKVYFATSDVEAMCAEVEGELELLFADSWVNKGLVVDVVEVVFGRLFPEILE